MSAQIHVLSALCLSVCAVCKSPVRDLQVALGPAAGGGASQAQLRNIALCSQLQVGWQDSWTAYSALMWWMRSPDACSAWPVLLCAGSCTLPSRTEPRHAELCCAVLCYAGGAPVPVNAAAAAAWSRCCCAVAPPGGPAQHGH
jgi:hypothetical protein